MADDLPDPDQQEWAQDQEPALPSLGPWVWEAMDPELRRARLRELSQWVGWLVRAFPRLQQTLQPCWWRHSDVREHLTALYAGWVRTYTGEPERDLAEAEWISTLHVFTPHLELKLCSSGRHDQAPELDWRTEGLEEELATSALGTLPAWHPAADAVARYRAAQAFAATAPKRS